MAIQRNISYHISEDRLDRACYIMTTIGIGEVIKEVHTIDEQGRGAWKCFTNTGVMLIFNEQRTRVVTLYIASQPQVSAMYKGNTPGWILRMVKKNVAYAQNQNKVRF